MLLAILQGLHLPQQDFVDSFCVVREQHSCSLLQGTVGSFFQPV